MGLMSFAELFAVYCVGKVDPEIDWVEDQVLWSNSSY